MKELNRFNMIKSVQTRHLSILLVMGVSLMLGCAMGCKKKERLTNSTFSFGITPPAAMVVRNGSVTLTAHGTSGGGSVGVSPTWSVSPSTIGILSTSLGPSVIFTSQNLGVAVVMATFDGLMTTSEIDVVTYIPDATTFDVYNDDGLPVESGITSGVFKSGGLNLIDTSTAGYTPEGMFCQRASDVSSGGFWGVTLDKNDINQNKNLSAFNSGSLKFSLRLYSRTMSSGEELRVEVSDLSGAAPVSIPYGGGGSYGFSGLEQGWQEISIPISSFIGAGLDTSQVEVPFAIVAFSLGSPLTFDVDAVRWEP